MKGSGLPKNRLVKMGLALLVGCCWLISASPSVRGDDASGSTGARYVFFLIGDGMGRPQRTAAELFLAAREGKPPGGARLHMSRMAAQGVMTTHAADTLIPGSADAVTAMACGVKTNFGMLGMTPDGRPVPSVAELARQKGMKIGIISTVSLDHATPAGFYAHQRSRHDYHEIAHQMAASGFDFFGGGGLRDPTGKASRAPKGDALETFKAMGYRIVTRKRDFLALKKEDGKVIAVNEWLQDSEAMPYAIDRTAEDLDLSDLLAKAIALLEGPEGFFIMAEGGKVDWACHANDAVSVVHEMLDFDRAVGAALAFHEKHPRETLVLVAGDHECGGMTIGLSGTRYQSHLEVLSGQKMSFQQFSDQVVGPYRGRHAGQAAFADMIPLIERHFGLRFKGNPDEDRMVLRRYEIEDLRQAFDRSMAGDAVGSKDPVTRALYRGYDPLTVTLTHILNRKAGLGWTSYSHTGVPVIVSAHGVGAERFNGHYDNTDIAKNLRTLMGVDRAAVPLNP